MIGKDESVDLGSIPMVKNSTTNKSEENIQIFDESMLDDDDNTSSQSSSYLSGASDDTYLKQPVIILVLCDSILGGMTNLLRLLI